MRHPEDSGRMDRRSFAARIAAAAAAASGWPPFEPSRVEAGEKPAAKAGSLRVRVWSEGTAPRSIYPDDIDGAIANHLRRQGGLDVKQARLDDKASGLADEALEATDVLIWWGRLRHADLPDSRARAVADRVRAGKLGLVALHASCCAKPFRELMGTSCEPAEWREDGRPERVTVESPDHEIARGVAPFTIPRAAMFVEPFLVPKPETVVFLSKFAGQEPFRGGLTWTVGKGRVAYFRPGHEAFPVLYHPSVRKVIANAARWVAPTSKAKATAASHQVEGADGTRAGL
jgi:trehalose utilization protein